MAYYIHPQLYTLQLLYYSSTYYIQIFLSSFPSFTWVKIKTKSLPIVETKTQLSFMHAQTKSTIVLFELLLPIHSFIHPFIHSIQSMKPGREPTVKESPKHSVLICQSSSLPCQIDDWTLIVPNTVLGRVDGIHEYSPFWI